MRYSQSFLKAYYSDECGLVLDAKFISNTYPPVDSEAMRKGRLFEYLATNYVRKGEQPPEPEYYKRNGDTYKVGDMKPEYVNIANHAQRFKSLALEMFPNMRWGVEYKYQEFAGIFDGVDDDCVLDTKCSDLIFDKWNTWGWDISRWEKTAERLMTEDLLTVLKFNPNLWQPLHYSWLFLKKHGKYPKWYFYIIHPKSDDVSFFKLDIRLDTHEAYKYLLPQIKTEVDMVLQTGGFEPKPTYNRCNKCELKETCKLKQINPQPQIIIL